MRVAGEEHGARDTYRQVERAADAEGVDVEIAAGIGRGIESTVALVSRAIPMIPMNGARG